MNIEMIPTRQREFLTGVRDQLPILVGVVPFGVIFGALARSVGIPALESQAFSLLIFAGSAQFIATGLIGEAAPSIVVVLTIALVNLRHLLYSATLTPHLTKLRLRWKISLSWLLTDEAFVMAARRYNLPGEGYPHWYYFGTGLTLWSAWQLSTFIGISIGTALPGTHLLDFALPITFIALLIPTLTDRTIIAVAITGGIFSVMLHGLPLKLGLILAVVISFSLGILLDRQHPGESKRGAAS